MGKANPTYDKIKGFTGIIRLPDERVWNKKDGVQRVQRYTGRNTQIRGLFNALSSAGSVSGGDQINESFDGKLGYLFIRQFDDNVTLALNDIWELIPNDLMKPIESHQDFNAISSAAKAAVMEKVRKAEPLPVGAVSVEKKLYAYAAHGVLDFIATDLFLRQSITVSNRSSITASYSGINTVVAKTLAQLTANIGPPAALIDIVKDLPRLGRTDGPWEWLKKAPQVSQVELTKFNIVSKWHGAERWADIYGGSWDPTVSD